MMVCESSNAVDDFLGISVGPLAQLVEQATLNRWVVGSIPTWPINTVTSGQFLVISYERGILYH